MRKTHNYLCGHTVTRDTPSRSPLNKVGDAERKKKRGAERACK